MIRTNIFLSVIVVAAACATKSEAPATSASQPAAAAASKPAEAAKPAEAMGAAGPMAPARGDDAKRKSKNGLLEAEIGGVPVKVQYGRPKVSGRDIFGELIPYGKVWRTGADEATTISFSKDATFAGQKVKSGTYALFTIPAEEGWKVVLNSEPKQWGAYKHDPSKDVLTAAITAEKHDNTEELTFAAAGDKLQMMWADVVVSMPVAAAE